MDLTRVYARALNLNTAEAEWLKIFTTMAKASEAPKTKDPVSADDKESNMITKKEYDCTIASIESAAMEKGHNQARAESAKRMLKAGLDENQIVQFSGLTLEEVKALSLS